MYLPRLCFAEELSPSNTRASEPEKGGRTKVGQRAPFLLSLVILRAVPLRFTLAEI